MFSEGNNDDDMDMTETDKVLCDGKVPVQSKSTEGKADNKKGQRDSETAAEVTSQRYLTVILCEYCEHHDCLIWLCIWKVFVKLVSEEP